MITSSAKYEDVERVLKAHRDESCSNKRKIAAIEIVGVLSMRAAAQEESGVGKTEITPSRREAG